MRRPPINVLQALPTGNLESEPSENSASAIGDIWLGDFLSGFDSDDESVGDYHPQDHMMEIAFKPEPQDEGMMEALVHEPGFFKHNGITSAAPRDQRTSGPSCPCSCCLELQEFQRRKS